MGELCFLVLYLKIIETKATSKVTPLMHIANVTRNLIVSSNYTFCYDVALVHFLFA